MLKLRQFWAQQMVGHPRTTGARPRATIFLEREHLPDWGVGEFCGGKCTYPAGPFWPWPPAQAACREGHSGHLWAYDPIHLAGPGLSLPGSKGADVFKDTFRKKYQETHCDHPFKRQPPIQLWASANILIFSMHLLGSVFGFRTWKGKGVLFIGLLDPPFPNRH